MTFVYPTNSKRKNYCDGRSKITSYPEFAKNIYSLAACKYLPDFFKQHCWLTGNEFESLRKVNGEYLPQSFSNADFYHTLLDNGLSVKSDKEFKFVHLDATHYPYTISEKVEELGEGNATLEQTIKGSVKIVQEYINEMKECGVYDKSSIIIMADHGYYRKGLITNPLLLVKPKNIHGKLQFSDACISQKDFQATLLSMAGLNDNMKYGYGFTDVDEGTDRERYYYQYVDVKNKDNRENRRLIEYKIDPDNNNRGSFHITGNEYNLSGEKVDHISICSVCQSGNGETDSFDTVIIHE